MSISVCSFSYVFAQELGKPHIRNYTPGEYKGFSQNWAIEQDNRGVMYFANGKGILEYNGKTWRRFYTDKGSTVLSLGKDEGGRIYVGGEGEIGFISSDSTGQTKYFSLLENVPEEERIFGYVWHIYSNNKGIYFVTPEKVIRLKDSVATVWHPEESFFTGFMVNETFYIVESQKGLKTLINDSLVYVKDYQKFAGTRAIFPYDDTHILIVTDHKGMYLYDNNNPPIPFENKAVTYLKKNQLYKGIPIPGDRFAFATSSGGVLIMSKEGEIIDVIDDKAGLQVPSVYALFVDKQSELWAGLSNGISRIEISSPFTYFDKTSGITGIVENIKRYDSVLYSATLDGFFHTDREKNDEEEYSTTNFTKLPWPRCQVFNIVAIDDQILFCGSSGIYSYIENKASLIHSSAYSIGMIKSEIYENTVFWSGLGEICALRLEDGKWVNYPVAYTGKQEIHFLAEQDKETLWAGTTVDGIIKISYKNIPDTNATIEWFDTSSGLPTGMLEVFMYRNELRTGSMKGIFIYDSSTNKFLPDTSLGEHAVNSYCYVLKTDNKNNLWMLKPEGVGFLKKENEGYHWNNKSFRRISRKFTDIYSIYSEEDGTCWIGGTNGISKYKPNSNKNINEPFEALIEIVYTRKDTLFNGAWTDKNSFIINTQPNDRIPVLKHENNALTFEFTATSFDAEEANLYKFILDGFDAEWTDWSGITKKEYTNLPEGDYIFRLIAINIHDTESEESRFSFSVLPPWHRTWWAFSLYFISAILIVYFIVYVNTRRLRAAKIRLEKIVEERTMEIRQQNQEILQQKEEIETQRDQIEGQLDKLMVQNEKILQANEEIEAQRDEIEGQRDFVAKQRDVLAAQNKEIEDSIKYAKRIQSAILPPEEFVATSLPEHFVYFRPRDIVSGDFYWAKLVEITDPETNKTSRKLVYTAADCTGHGVPGAFMSMLGVSFLNEIISNYEKENNNSFLASDILNNLRTHIIEALHQSAIEKDNKTEFTRETVQDGMDAAICILNLDTNVLDFAGANNPLYIISDKQETLSSEKEPLTEIKGEASSVTGMLVEVKGDKMPVGVYYGDTLPQFTNHRIELKKGDTLYVFSDGFADQFGGSKGKKFKYKPFKQLLISINKMTLADQKQFLNNKFEEWTNPASEGNESYEQIDDIIIIGLRIS